MFLPVWRCNERPKAGLRVGEGGKFSFFLNFFSLPFRILTTCLARVSLHALHIWPVALSVVVERLLANARIMVLQVFGKWS